MTNDVVMTCSPDTYYYLPCCSGWGKIAITIQGQFSRGTYAVCVKGHLCVFSKLPYGYSNNAIWHWVCVNFKLPARFGSALCTEAAIAQNIITPISAQRVRWFTIAVQIMEKNIEKHVAGRYKLKAVPAPPRFVAANAANAANGW